MTLQSKLPDVGTTIFTVMSRLAMEHGAINLSQGFPDFDVNDELIGWVNKAMKDGFNQYAPMPGWMPLRESIAEKVEFLYKTKVNPDTEITITPGGTCAIYSALTAILNAGDEVIVFEPAYDSYIPNVEINGAKILLLPGHLHGNARPQLVVPLLEEGRDHVEAVGGAALKNRHEDFA